MRKRLCAALAALLALGLSACGGGGVTAEDAAGYVRGLLDRTYLGRFDQEELTRAGLDEQSAQAAYQQGLEAEYARFAAAFDLDPDRLSDERGQQVLDLLAELYRHADYTVTGARAAGEGFTVEVTVRPVDLLPRVAREYGPALEAEFAAFYAQWDTQRVEELSEQERERFWREYEARWAEEVVGLVREHLEELDYQREKTLSLPFLPDENGVYTVSEQAFAELAAQILPYEAA